MNPLDWENIQARNKASATSGGSYNWDSRLNYDQNSFLKNQWEEEKAKNDMYANWNKNRFAHIQHGRPDGPIGPYSAQKSFWAFIALLAIFVAGYFGYNAYNRFERERNYEALHGPLKMQTYSPIGIFEEPCEGWECDPVAFVRLRTDIDLVKSALLEGKEQKGFRYIIFQNQDWLDIKKPEHTGGWIRTNDIKGMKPNINYK